MAVQPSSVKTRRRSAEPDMATLVPGPSVHTAPGLRARVVRFVPDDEVRGRETVEAASDGVNAGDLDALVGVKLSSGGDEAMRHSCRVQCGAGLGDEEISMTEEPRAPAFLSRPRNHVSRQRSLARSGRCLDEHGEVLAESGACAVDYVRLIIAEEEGHAASSSNEGHSDFSAINSSVG